jgi:hypothetical protein
MPKSTRAEVDRRIAEVFKLRLGGAELPDIREYAQAQSPPWGVTDAQLWRYVKAADALCRKYLDGQSEHLLARHLLQRRQLYAHAMSAGDFRAALAVLKDEAELEGLYAPRKVALTDPTGTREYSGGLTDADRHAALQNLYARVGERAGGAPAAEPPAAAGPLLGGPGQADGRRGDAARPLAGGASTAALPPDAAPLFPPGG